MSHEEHMIINHFQQGIEELACSLRRIKEKCLQKEGEWRHLEEERARLIQIEQNLQAQISEAQSTLETMASD